MRRVCGRRCWLRTAHTHRRRTRGGRGGRTPYPTSKRSGVRSSSVTTRQSCNSQCQQVPRHHDTMRESIKDQRESRAHAKIHSRCGLLLACTSISSFTCWSLSTHVLFNPCEKYRRCSRAIAYKPPSSPPPHTHNNYDTRIARECASSVLSPPYCIVRVSSVPCV